MDAFGKTSPTHKPSASDTDLLRLYAKHGDEAAFAEIAQRYHQMIYATALRACKHGQDAEDVLQSTLIVLARRAGKLNDIKCLGAWLHRVATLESMKTVRKNTARRNREQLAAEDLTPVEAVRWRKVAPELDRCLLALNNKDREIIVLHYLEGKTFARAAEYLGSTSEACRKRCSRAMDKLSAMLKRQGVQISVAALSTGLIASQAKAGTTSYTLSQITSSALIKAQTATSITLTTQTITTMLINKGILAAIIGGITASVTWSTLKNDTPSATDKQHASQPHHRKSPRSYRQPESALYSAKSSKPKHNKLEIFRQAMQAMNNSNDPFIGSIELKALIFTFSQEDIPQALEILHELTLEERHNDIAKTLYARWAELAPEQAFQEALTDEEYGYSSRYGVYVSWLNSDPAKAIAAMKDEWNRRVAENHTLRTKPENESMLMFLRDTAATQPETAAKIYELLTDIWPEEANQPLHNSWIYAWANNNHNDAAQWIIKNKSPEDAKLFLGAIADQLAQKNPTEALNFTSIIDDPAQREVSRNQVIKAWSSNKGLSVDGTGKLNALDLTSGFPKDWSNKNIDAFAQGLASRHTDQVNQLLNLPIAADQKNAVISGVLKGAAEGNSPAIFRHIIKDLPESFTSSAQGKTAIERYVEAFRKKEPENFKKWIQNNPNITSQPAE